MPNTRIEIGRPVRDVTLGSGQSFTSKTIDLRTGIIRIDEVLAQGIAASSQPDYKVFWFGGVTTSEIDGTPTGDVDRFEPFDAHDPLVNTNPGGTHTEGSENWLSADVPNIPWPFVRFYVLAAGGSPSAVYNVFTAFRRG